MSCEAWRPLEAAAAPGDLLKPGNGILLALWRCGDDRVSASVLSLAGATSVGNNAASVEKGRTYAECCLSHKISMKPHLGFNAKEDGHYLLHLDGDGSPSCALVHVERALDKASVYFKDNAGEVGLSDVHDAVLAGRDSRLAVAFHVDLCPAAQAQAPDEGDGDAGPLAGLSGMMA